VATSEKLINIESKHEDVQNRPDDRNVSINKVGICDLKIPLILQGCEKIQTVTQQVQAVFSLSVDLDGKKKGIHMSRLLETVLDHNKELSLNGLKHFLEDLSKRQLAKNAYAKIDFDYFFTKVAPVSGIQSPQAYSCSYDCSYGSEGIQITQSVEVPVKTLCPCSKEISDYGAHSQRSKVWITLTHNLDNKDEVGITLEEIVEIAENGASSPLYPILKREDERHVTMSAYDKPCFVEDVVRNISIVLNGDKRFNSFEIRVINFESIHSHNAFAVIQNNNI
jgi:GTP cyclohydrolase I